MHIWRSLAIAPLLLARPAAAADQPFDAGLMRLAEVLGSLHFLRNLCGEKGDAWRGVMEKLLEAENPDAGARARNSSPASTAATAPSRAPTRAAPPRPTEAIGRYMKEGESAGARHSPPATAIKPGLTFSAKASVHVRAGVLEILMGH